MGTEQPSRGRLLVGFRVSGVGMMLRLLTSWKTTAGDLVWVFGDLSVKGRLRV